MANEQRDKIVYDFEDIRRNDDPVPEIVLAQFGLEDEEENEDEGQEDELNTEEEEEEGTDDTEGTDDLNEEEQDDKTARDRTAEFRKELLRVKREAKRAVSEAKNEAGEEIGKLNKRIQELERRGETDELEEEFTAKVEDLEGRIEEAMEKGNSKEVVQLTRELSELTADNRVRRAKLTADHEEPDDLEDEPDRKILPRAQEWLDSQSWWGDSDMGHIRKFVHEADAALRKRGYLPSDDDFYEQLEDLVEKKYPGVVERTMGDEFEEEEDEDLDDVFSYIPSKKTPRRKAKVSKKRPRSRSPVSPGGDGGAGGGSKKRGKKKGRTLTRAQIGNMRAFGMDPENKEHIEAYLDNNP